VHLTADRKRNRKERSIIWTTKAPPTSRAGPQDIYTKPQKISNKAKAAKSHADLWSLFFTADMQTKICTNTNMKIQEDIIKKGLTEHDIAQMSHIKPIDEVDVISTSYQGTIFEEIRRWVGISAKAILFGIRKSKENNEENAQQK
jgi:hypothetical protein